MLDNFSKKGLNILSSLEISDKIRLIEELSKIEDEDIGLIDNEDITDIIGVALKFKNCH